MHGKGKRSWNNGDVYEGQYAYGLAHGKGIFRYADGDVYEGSF